MMFLLVINDSEKSAVVGMILIAVIIFVFYTLVPTPKKEYKPDPDEKAQRDFAKKILRGETDAGKISEKEGFDPKHIESWVKAYTDLAVKYALDADKYAEQIILLEQDIAWFSEVCRKHIGDDWREKTGFGEHHLDKYK